MLKYIDCKQIDETYIKDMITKLNSEYKLGYNIPFYTVNVGGNDEPFILSADFNTIFDDVLPSYRLSFMRNTVMTLDPSLSTEYAAGIIASTVNYILRKIDSYNYNNTEDSKMKKSEEIQNEIKKTQEQLANLQKALKEAEESETRVPNNLRFQNGETHYSMATTGAIIDGEYNDDDYTDHVSMLTRRLFKTREYAEMFTKKAQFIADCLHFKYLYDRDYEPDWGIPFESKYYIIYDYNVNKYIDLSTSSFMNESTVYFSTREIANKCAAWLNEKRESYE